MWVVALEDGYGLLQKDDVNIYVHIYIYIRLYIYTLNELIDLHSM